MTQVAGPKVKITTVAARTPLPDKHRPDRHPGGRCADPESLAAKIGAALEFKNQVLVKIYNRKALNPTEITEAPLAQAEGFKHRIADTRLMLGNALESGETVLLEGSQGTLLDVDHGTYPYVTSSNPTAGGRRWVPDPTRITAVLGILKAATTRVGSGPPDRINGRDPGAYPSKTGGEGHHRSWPGAAVGSDAVIALPSATRVNGIN